MSNRVYLYFTNFEEMPNKAQQEEFVKVSGNEYEANACIPMFWLCLFSVTDIKAVASDHDGFDDDSRPYPYLLCKRSDGINQLKSRASMMERVLGADRFALYLEWVSRVENCPFENILIKTEELDWMCQEGELENDLRKALKHLEQVSLQGDMKISNAMGEIIGLWDQENLNECEGFELVGCANGKDNWPPRFTPAYIPTSVSKNSKPWWRFW